MARTMREIKLAADETRTRELIQQWLQRNGFEILERDSTGRPVEKSFRTFKVRLATHPGTIVAWHARRLGIIVFEIKVESRDRGCLVHAEFYVAGAGGGMVDYLGREFDVSEKPDLVGRLPRKKGFRLMNRFIADLGG